MKLPALVDPASFLLGLAIASILWWILVRTRPLWKEIKGNLQKGREAVRARRMSTVEEDHRRATLRRAQGLHLAAPLFALNDVLVTPRLLSPPARVEPGSLVGIEDAVTLAVPYLPAWPEFSAIYHAPTLSLAEALSGGVNIAIIGQPGMGKTVALAYLASLAANRNETLGPLADSIPFLVHVADLRLPTEGVRDVLDRVGEMTAEHASVLDLGRVDGFVQGAFRSGRALFLLDGFDELTSEGQRDVTDCLKQLMQEYPKVRVVTTGAPEYVDGLVGLGFVPLAISAWSSDDRTQFVRQWCDLWSTPAGMDMLPENSRAKPDATLLWGWLNLSNEDLSPLELTLKLWGAVAGDWLGPSNIDAITSHARRLAPSSVPIAALETLAMQVMLTAQPIFDPRKARAWVKAFELPEEAGSTKPNEAQDSSREPTDSGESGGEQTREKSAVTPTPGLLGRLAGSGFLVAFPRNKMRFVHPVIGGLLAGRALSGYKAEETLLDQPDWIGKLLTMRYFAAHTDVKSLVERMLEWSRLPMHRPLLTAARWLRDAPEAASWRTRLMTALAELLRTEGLPLALRAQALAALISSTDPTVATLFRQLSSTVSYELMHLAALGSGALRDEKATNALEEMMQAPSITTRRAACLALVSIGTTAALESVGKALLQGDEDLRRAAAEALANDRTEGYAMLNDGATMEDILLRRATVYGLGRVPEDWAANLLEKMRVEDAEWVIRNLAGEMLEARRQSSNPCIPRPLKPPSESPWLIAFAGSQGVGVSPGSPATDLLLTALKSGNEEQRLAALSYLKQRPSDGVIRQIYEGMFGPSSELREAAYSALWEIGASGYKLPDPSQYGLI